MMSKPAFDIQDVLYRRDPVGDAVPLVLDSPHSGDTYPSDFGYIAPFDQMRMGEDAFIDDMFSDAPGHGAWLMAARFPRSYIDPNRDLVDLDTSMIDGDWPDPVTDGDKIALGMGLIWKVGRPGLDLYDRLLSVEEVRNRIDKYWRPYHAELQGLIDQAHQRWGRVWHLNCHSMPSADMCAEIDLPLVPSADFVLGDRDGTTASPEFVSAVQNSLLRQGYTVAINAPFKGVELVRKHGDPANGRESLQIEVNRGLYMDEHAITRTEGFAGLKSAMSVLIADLAAFIRKDRGL